MLIPTLVARPRHTSCQTMSVVAQQLHSSVWKLHGSNITIHIEKMWKMLQLKQ